MWARQRVAFTRDRSGPHQTAIVRKSFELWNPGWEVRALDEKTLPDALGDYCKQFTFLCKAPGIFLIFFETLFIFPRASAKGSSQKNICRSTPPLHLHIFTSVQSRCHLYLCSSSHLRIYISAHLHILTSTSQLIFIFTHLHLCSSSHLHVYISAHLHILISTSHILTSRSS